MIYKSYHAFNIWNWKKGNLWAAHPPSNTVSIEQYFKAEISTEGHFEGKSRT